MSVEKDNDVSVDVPTEVKKKCPLCEDVVAPKGIYVHFRNSHPEEVPNWTEWKPQFTEVKVPIEIPVSTAISFDEEGADDVMKPIEIEVLDEVIKFIGDRIGEVYGLGKSKRNKEMIIRSLHDDPTPLRDANLLHQFLKMLAPKAIDSQLRIYVINPLYTQYPNLAQTVDKYLREIRGAAPPPTTQYYPSGGYGGAPSQPYYQPTAYPQYPPPGIGYPAPPYGYPPGTPGRPPHYPKPPQMHTIVIDGVTIETDNQGLLAWKQYQKEVAAEKRNEKEHEIRMAQLKKPTPTPDTVKIPVKIGGEVKDIPANLAPLYMQNDRDRDSQKAISDLREKLADERKISVEKEIHGLRVELQKKAGEPNVYQQIEGILEIAEKFGYQRTGVKTTLDVIENIGTQANARVAQVLDRVAMPGSGEEFEPDVSRTQPERKQTQEEIKARLEQAEEIQDAEDELLEAIHNI